MKTIIRRLAAQPNKWTFQIRPIAKFIYTYFNPNQLWVDPFAGENSPAHIKNDINPERPTEYHLDALEFLRLFPDNHFDGALYDPPYSFRQATECYKGFNNVVSRWRTKQYNLHNRKKINYLILNENK